MFRLFVWSLIFVFSSCFFSTSYRKCILKSKGYDIGSLKGQRIPIYKPQFTPNIDPFPFKKVQYEQLNFLFVDYIGAGGSGEVYLVEDAVTGKLKILKRFFKEKIDEFEKQNYIMEKINETIYWHHENNEESGPTMAVYEARDSIKFKQFEMENKKFEFPLIFYKLAKKVQQIHEAGIIHHDLKMGNVLVYFFSNSMHQIHPQLIDWNLASFYYPGLEELIRKGTSCFYPPQQLYRSLYPTPAIDVWALAVVMFVYATDQMPFPLKCKRNNIKAISSLVGSARLKEVFEKYNYYIPTEDTFTRQILKDPNQHSGVSLYDRVPSELKQIFDDQLIELLEDMLEVDPEFRLTISQVLQHPYFDRVKRLPKMYEEKEESRKDEDEQVKKAPANNLVQAITPSSTMMAEALSQH